jgi:anti-sigma regulatory factor (Ser/Thr protein kinase)
MEFSLSVSAEVANLAVIRRFVEEIATSLRADRKAIDDMLQAVEEATANIIFHGYHGQPGNIEIEMGQEQGALVVRLRDQALPFDPTRVPPPDLTSPLETRRFGGLGVHLIRQFTDQMTYRVMPEGGNELTLRKNAKWTSQEDK